MINKLSKIVATPIDNSMLGLLFFFFFFARLPLESEREREEEDTVIHSRKKNKNIRKDSYVSLLSCSSLLYWFKNSILTFCGLSINSYQSSCSFLIEILFYLSILDLKFKIVYYTISVLS